MYQERPLIMIKSQLYLKDNYVTISLLKKKDIFKKRFSIQFNTRKITQALFDSLPVFFFENNNIGSHGNGNFKWYTMYVIFRGRYVSTISQQSRV